MRRITAVLGLAALALAGVARRGLPAVRRREHDGGGRDHAE